MAKKAKRGGQGTPATVALEAAGVPFTVHAYAHDPAAAERATGYVLGGISPLGQRKRLRTVVDDGALAHPTVFVSAGRRGLEVELDPRQLIELTAATPAPIARRG